MRISSKLKYKTNRSTGPLAILVGSLFVLLASSASMAQQAPQQGKRGGPPPEAFAACESSTQNDVCSVTTDRGTITGTCQADRRKKETLLCVPSDRQGKPDEAKPAPEDSSPSEN